jgi:PAS domain S-box-containing protein
LRQPPEGGTANLPTPNREFGANPPPVWDLTGSFPERIGLELGIRTMKSSARLFGSAGFVFCVGMALSLAAAYWVARWAPEEKRPGAIGIVGAVFTLAVSVGLHLRTRHSDEIAEIAEAHAAEALRAKEALEKENVERIQAEAELEKERNLLRTLLDILPCRIFAKDAESRFTLANVAQARIFGLDDPEEVKGKTTFDFIPDEGSERRLADDREVMRSEVSFVNREEFAYEEDGGKRWSLTTKVPLKNSAGEVVGLVGTSTDITERKLATEALAAKNRELEMLLYVISHDLREPLRAIENFSRLVNDRYAEKIDEKGQDFLRRVVAGAQRLDRLLDDILTLSRVQRMEQPNTVVNLEEIVQEALARLEARIEQTGASVRIVRGLPSLHANRTYATEAVYNLVSNALKFVKAGERPEVEIAPYETDEKTLGEVGFVVRDRGPGVEPKHSERIFEIFQRTVGREVEGTGAGLAIVRQIAERHGGRAWVQPREGGGSEFIITFETRKGLKGGLA